MSPQHQHRRRQQQQQQLSCAAQELEALKQPPSATSSTYNTALTVPEARFPLSCRALLYSIEGNDRCVDCGSPHPQWASITYGSLLCLQCSGHHRSLGVARSRVRSIDMDHWTHAQVLQMLEGGNAQLHQFFHRHRLAGPTLEANRKRYRTKAALFYRTHLAHHVNEVAQQGVYRGREATRQQPSQGNNPNHDSEHNKTTTSPALTAQQSLQKHAPNSMISTAA